MPALPRLARQTIVIENASRSSVVCSCARLADSPVSRLRGLLGQRELAAGSGLLLVPSSGVHTFGMSMTIDVVALDRTLRILKIWPDVLPNRIRTGARHTHSVLELQSGRALECGLSVGDQLTIRPAVQPGAPAAFQAA